MQNKYKVTAVNQKNSPIAQVCVLASSEREAADWLHSVLCRISADRPHFGIKVLAL